MNDGAERATPAFARWVSQAAKARFEEIATHRPPLAASVGELRDHYDRLNSARLEVAERLYAVEMRHGEMAGVPVHEVGPRDAPIDGGVLICLHGGAFMWGSGAGALIEAMPIAAVSRIPVIAVEYRLAPEHSYPHAVDDVLTVVRHLRGTRPGVKIGIYGCSAGAVLTAQVVARLMREGDEPPRAIAMLHAAGLDVGGDSLELAALTNGTVDAAAVQKLHDLPYFIGADSTDPLVFPGDHPEVLAAFPPSLLVTGSRDFAASSVAVMDRRLKAAGAETEFVLFDGMWHAHHVDVDLPESSEVFALLAEFFRRHMT